MSNVEVTTPSGMFGSERDEYPVWVRVYGTRKRIVDSKHVTFEAANRRAEEVTNCDYYDMITRTAYPKQHDEPR